MLIPFYKRYQLNCKHFITVCFILSSLIIKAQSKELIDPAALLSEYIKIRSVQGHEFEAGKFLSEVSSAHGLNINIFTDKDSSYNFSASLYPLTSGKPNIIFLNHLDVVPAEDSTGWKFPPYSGTIYNNDVWGRGAIDCKGLAIMQLLALISFTDSAKLKDLPYNVTMLCVSGEETNSAYGSGIITEKYINELNPIVVFGEGGSGIKNVIDSDTSKLIFGISVAEKRSLCLKLEVNSESFGHGAVPSDLYANKKLLRVLIKLMDEKKYVKFDKLQRAMFHQLGKMEGGLKGFVIRHINWDIFWPVVRKKLAEGEPLHLLVYNTFSITNISNPKGPSNQIAEKASAILDCRLLPGSDSAKFLRKMKNSVGPKVNITVLSASPDASASKQDKFFSMVSSVIKENFSNSEIMPVLLPATTDNNYFRNKNINAYGIMPVVLSLEEMESVHNKDEHISITNLKRGIKVFKEFIYKVNQLK